jgi:hypothetical protein
MVLYELINEPLYVPLSTYQTEMRAAIDAIRTHNSNAICLVPEVGASDWDTASLQFEQSYPISRSNIVYVVHDYGYHFTDNSQSTIRWKLGSNGAYCHYADWMLANGRCVITTEFGGGYNNDPYVAWNSWQATWIQNFMAVMNADGYSGYTAWRWTTGAMALLVDYNGNPSAYGTVLQTSLPVTPPTSS